MLKAVLADFTTQVDYLTQDELLRQPLSAQPGTRGWGETQCRLQCLLRPSPTG